MGKKKRAEDYDKEALITLARNINHCRKPRPEVKIPELQISLEKLKEVIQILSRDDREALERFWGLIPGTRKHYMRFPKRNKKDIALAYMFDNSKKAIYSLMKIEYLHIYAENVQVLIADLVKKMDKAGAEEVSDIDAIKYLIIYLIFIEGGPSLLFEGDGHQIDLKKEERFNFDEFAVLQTFWEAFGLHCKDYSINLALIIEIVEMFDLKDVITMKSFVRLPVSKEDKDIQVEDVSSFKAVRFFKERLFPAGAWEFTSRLVLCDEIEKETLERVADHFMNLRRNWNDFLNFKHGTKRVNTSAGEREILTYKIEDFEFTDIYEVMVLTVCKSW